MNGFDEWWDKESRVLNPLDLKARRALARKAWEAAKELAVKKAAEKRKEDFLRGGYDSEEAYHEAYNRAVDDIMHAITYL